MSNDNVLEEWEYNGGSWDVDSFSEIGARKIIEISINDGISNILGTSLNIDGYVYKDGGFNQGDTNWIASDYIPCIQGEVYLVNLQSNSENMLVFSAYDDKQKIILEKSINGLEWDNSTKEFTIPEGVSYFRFCSSSKISYYAFKKSEDLKTIVHDTKETLLNILNYIDLDIEIVGFIDTNGSLVVDSNWISSDFISVNKGDLFYTNLVGNILVSSIAYYDNNNNYLSDLSVIDFMR